MKSKLFFIQLIVSVFCFVPLLLGTLLTIQLSTKPTNPFSNWQTTLFILVLYLILLVTLLLNFFLLRLVKTFPSKETFTKKSLKLSSKIRSCLLCITILAFGILPKFYQIADMSDSPGILLIAFVLLFIPFFIYILSSILIDLLKQAIYLKNDYDLTV
ncbi:DUF2975 domain-containing protein [Enterococcus hirae]|uniref:DUF2975 domain-containing protein n=1 Tax=Enterococcus TaxID=1350 RepID=UPI0009BF20C2|nr:DUF2975 domain-containing protein [Enterococcus hirae]OWW63739.1 hypothetical protein F521_05770 [Enterococcus hirae 67-03-C5]OWW67257.1 hypothetical protein C656_06190 [Enterococcus hirae 57-03-H11]EMF0059765.1 DUF2975 domain-containing protein [Enterococcus hirae]EMF0082951.1 DUF2975 domain-containing protein [Enterococcus hirae]EMF0092098.1 DUF2975 domain-containing protein [Enterococcus hirae]